MQKKREGHIDLYDLCFSSYSVSLPLTSSFDLILHFHSSDRVCWWNFHFVFFWRTGGKRDKQTDRQTHRQTDRETDIIHSRTYFTSWTHIRTDIYTYTHTPPPPPHTHTHTHTHTHIYVYVDVCIHIFKHIFIQTKIQKHIRGMCNAYLWIKVKW